MADVPPGVKGMNDILAPEVSKWQFLEQKARDVLEAFAYRELRTPVLEYTPLFVRSVGEVTDVVEKQMYTFDDRDGRSVSLRPEGTASAVRAYIERAQWNKEPVTRWYYIGPMFRHERAQRGRLRQFHQVGAEVFGVAEPSVDAEMIAMLVDDAGATSASPAARSRSPSTRWASPRSARPTATRSSAYFSAHRDKLDDDSRRRLETNPLRILDSKNPTCMRWSPRARPMLLDDAGRRLAGAASTRVRALLDALGVTHRDRPAPRARPRLLHRRRSSRSRRRPATSARRTPSRAAAATTAWSRRWAARARRRIGFALGIERALLAHPRAAPRATSRRSTCSSRRWTPAALDYALPIAHRLRARRHPRRDRAPPGQPEVAAEARRQAARARRHHHRRERDRVGR